MPRAKTKSELISFGEEEIKKLIKPVKNNPAEKLEIKKKYKWTGSTNMASYFASASSSHYVWASDLLKKHID